MPIVFLHGLGQKPEDWNPVINRLPKGSQALCPNLYALERDGEDYPALYGAFEQYCDGLEGLLDLCGLSLGGVLALQYAAEHPERVSSLALIGARASMPGGLLAIQIGCDLCASIRIGCRFGIGRFHTVRQISPGIGGDVPQRIGGTCQFPVAVSAGGGDFAVVAAFGRYRSLVAQQP